MQSIQVPLAFGFGQAAMLAWLAAASAPILIHLWNRRRHREVPWAAVEFLLVALRNNSRRIRLEQWLLLAVRTLIIVCVVLAMAEPYLERVGLPFVGGERTHKVLVLDASYSMAYRPGEASRFDRAKEVAAQIIDESPHGDAFSLVLMGSPPRVVVGKPAFAGEELIDEISGLAVSHGSADLPATIVAIENALAQARQEQPRISRHEIYFLTDLQRVGWLPELDRAAGAEFRERSRRLSQRAALAVIDLGAGETENLAVTGIRPSEAIATTGRELSADVTVRNFGRQAVAQQLIELFVDGRRVAEGRVDLRPQEEAAVSFPFRFEGIGEHQVEARLNADLLDCDNHRFLALPVKETLAVLCVDGRPGGSQFGSATDYLKVALAPQSAGQGRPVHVEVVTEGALRELDLPKYDAIFLCNVPQFTAAEARLLHAYVEQGGGLVFFLGDQVRADSYNRYLGGQERGVPRVLPALVGAATAPGQYRFDPLDYQHGLISVFRGQEQSGLLTTPISQYLKLTPVEGAPAKVALGFAGGDPAIVEEPIGHGRSIVVATSADVSWTVLPMWSSFVPLVHELLALAASGRFEERNIEVGQPLTGESPASAAELPIVVAPPQGEPASASTTAGSGLWQFDDTFQSGIYTVRFGAQGNEQQFAVNTNTAESDLTPLSVDELRSEVWPGIAFHHQTSWRNALGGVSPQLGGRGRLNGWLIAAALSLLLFEPLLAWRMGRYRR
ncbi:MAG: BatA domain-containing protein [Pirellulales bacterium]|nr:BatA domain-containing protein [Pirellulales bacterium]